MRPMTHGSERRSRSASRLADPWRTRSATDGSVSPGSDPPPTVARVADDIDAGCRPRRGESAETPSARAGARRRQPRWRARRGCRSALARRGRARAWRRPRRASPCPVASPSRGVAAEPRHEVRATHDEPGLRAADELVAGERDEVGAGGQPLARHGLMRQAERGRVEEGAGTEVVDERDRPCAERGPRARRGPGPRRSPPGGSSSGGPAG